jgi:endonuclease/exonuclease/phosphatase family metal-dependent hydrolase
MTERKRKTAIEVTIAFESPDDGSERGSPLTKRKFAAARLAVLLATTLSAGCAAREPVSIKMLYNPPCAAASGVGWAGPDFDEDRARLSAWCQAVGPVVVNDADPSPVEISRAGLTVVSWNQHEDYGDLERLLNSYIRKTPVIVLLQEVARMSDGVPLEAPAIVRVPRRINPEGQMKQDIEAIAEKFHLSLAYLPSMPNGLRTREDRGCAILSTLPLSNVMGIELPWVAQRRVAVMATVTALRNGEPWFLRVMSVHLDNRSGRTGQAAAVAAFLARPESSAGLPTVIGGDLNTLYGIQDQAVTEFDRIAPLVHECGSQATFRFRYWFGLRLDHLFTTLPLQDRAGCVVEPERFGSDHHPIVLRLFKAPQSN